MALLQVFNPTPSNLYLRENAEISVSQGERFQIRGMYTGWHLTFSGTGFAYDDGDLVGGTITGYELNGMDGALLFRVSGLWTSVQDFFNGSITAMDAFALGGDDTVHGSSRDDTLGGLGGNDIVFGAGGNDLLHSVEPDIDTLAGGSGNDHYQASPGDLVQEAPDDGVDLITLVGFSPYASPYETLAITGTYAMADNVENLRTSANTWRVIGNALANRMETSGYLLTNRLEGMEGNDTLVGSENRTTLAGGNGDDVYELSVHSSGDPGPVLYEEAAGGYDTVYSGNVVQVELAPHIEKLVINGSAGTGIGNAQDNLIVYQGPYWSRLDGGAGVDTLVGGPGNDTFVVDDPRDVIVLGGGIDDLVVQAPGMTIRPGISTMWMQGAANLAYGSAAADHIVGNDSGGNTIVGADGNDTLESATYVYYYADARAPLALHGGRGDDQLRGGTGPGLMDGGAGRDTATVPYGDYRITRLNGDVLLQSSGSAEPTIVLRGVEVLQIVQKQTLVLNAHLVEGSVGIGGEVAAGATLQSATTLRDLDGLGTLQYQWFRSDVAIEGATAASYVMAGADAGSEMRLRVQFVDGEGSLETAWSNILETQAQLAATTGADLLQGGNAAESISAGAGNDSISGGGGNDTLVGADGLDTAFYGGPRGEYALVRQGQTTFVTDILAVRDGADELTQVELLRFDDRTVDLRAAARASAISASDLKTIEELYVGFFDRIPEADGLVYWIDQRAAGMSLGTIAQSFWEAGKVFGLYETFGWTPWADNMRKIYANVLQRPLDGPDAPTTSELQYWYDWIQYQANHTFASRSNMYGWFGDMVLQMLHDVHAAFEGDPKYGYVPALLNHKAALANYYALEQGLGSTTPMDSIAYGQQLADLVVPEGIAAAIEFIGVNPVVELAA